MSQRGQRGRRRGSRGAVPMAAGILLVLLLTGAMGLGMASLFSGAAPGTPSATPRATATPAARERPPETDAGAGDAAGPPAEAAPAAASRAGGRRRVVDPASFPAGTAERTGAEFVTAWRDRDFARMARSVRPSWLADQVDPVAALSSAFGGVRLLGAELADARASGAAAKELSFDVAVEVAPGRVAEGLLRAAVAQESPGGSPAGVSPAWGVDPAAVQRGLAALTRQGGVDPAAVQRGLAALTRQGGVASAAESALSSLRATMAGAAAPAGEPPYASGGLGLSLPSWQAQAAARDGGGAAAWYVANHQDGTVVRVEKWFAQGQAIDAEAARREARALAPSDARRLRDMPAGAGRAAELYASDSLRGRFLSPAVWEGGQPGEFVVVYERQGEAVSGLVLAVGARLPERRR